MPRDTSHSGCSSRHGLDRLRAGGGCRQAEAEAHGEHAHDGAEGPVDGGGPLRTAEADVQGRDAGTHGEYRGHQPGVQRRSQAGPTRLPDGTRCREDRRCEEPGRREPSREHRRRFNGPAEGDRCPRSDSPEARTSGNRHSVKRLRLLHRQGHRVRQRAFAVHVHCSDCEGVEPTGLEVADQCRLRGCRCDVDASGRSVGDVDVVLGQR